MMLLSEAANYMDGELLCGEEAWVASAGSDSRNIAQQELFFALKGESFDGHAYAQQALKQGACAVVISDKACNARPAILVKDTVLALGDLAKSWRIGFTLPVIAITGSNGKTTVKEMLTNILEAASNQPNAVLATVGNLNNHIGMPITLLKIRKQHAYAVIEMGMNHLGEIDYLTRIAQPTIAVINNAGTAHIGELGSRDNIAKAKGEIFAGLGDDGVAVINADDDYVDYWKSLNAGKKIITFGLNKAADISATYDEQAGAKEQKQTQVKLSTPTGSVTFNLAVLGKHNISNALAASAAAVALGISNQDIARGLGNMQAVYGRLQRRAGFNGAVLIDDTYNANPDSMKAAIDVLAAHQNSIFVMGDMAELGENASQMHADIGLYAKQKGIEQFYTFGDLSAKACDLFGQNAAHFSNLESLVSALKNQMKQGVTVLVKGSRSMQMERVVKQILEKASEEASKKVIDEKIEREKTQCY
ncbi:MAG: UDP-N-acetylmuramoyl-tripeptide--D-alanyl-D-alanine ligase [Bdellovibrio sp.]|nr:UDP-N-acetylmuramoyl-tripeptide--D-alanyl-D-alanine ligase [Methylotenera sp.]